MDLRIVTVLVLNSYVDSILQVSVKANRPIYETVREDLKMCEALRELMKDEIDAEVAKGMERGLEQGMERGLERGLEQGMERGLEQGILSSINNLMCSMKMTAEQAMEALMIPKNKREFYYSKLTK
jgi:flagellar biosynthesis/type III secretory pathway protein FliH